MNDIPNFVPNSERYGDDYIYDDDLLIYRVLKPKNPEEDNLDGLKTVFHINLEEFEELYFGKLYYFKLEYEASEENFLDEYIDFLGWVLHLYEWKPDEIQVHYDHIEYDTEYNRKQFLRALSIFEKLTESFDRKKVIFPTEKKIAFLKTRLEAINKSKEAILNPSNLDDASKTKWEKRFFEVAERFNLDILSEYQPPDDELFEKLINTATSNFIEEITANTTNFNLEATRFYLERLKERLKNIEVNIKVFDEETIQYFCLKTRVNDDTNTKASNNHVFLSSDYIYSLIFCRRKIIDYINQCSNSLEINNTTTESDSALNYISKQSKPTEKHLREFVNLVKNFVTEELESHQAQNNDMFESKLIVVTDYLIDEISDNCTNLPDSISYLNNTIEKLSKLKVFYKVFSVDSGEFILKSYNIEKSDVIAENTDAKSNQVYKNIVIRHRTLVLNHINNLKNVNDKNIETNQNEVKSFKYLKYSSNSSCVTELMKAMQDAKLIHQETKLVDFRKVFNAEVVVNKIFWTGAKSELSYFVRKLIVKTDLIEIPKNTHWKIAKSCFVKVDGSQFTNNEFRSAHPPASASKIEDLIRFL